MKSISRVLQKLIESFNGTAISVFFKPSALVLLVYSNLILNNLKKVNVLLGKFYNITINMLYRTLALQHCLKTGPGPRIWT